VLTDSILVLECHDGINQGQLDGIIMYYMFSKRIHRVNRKTYGELVYDLHPEGNNDSPQ